MLIVTYPDGMDPVLGLAELKAVMARPNVGDLAIYRRSWGAIICGPEHRLAVFRMCLFGFETTLSGDP